MCLGDYPRVMWISILGVDLAATRSWSSVVELERYRRLLVARAEHERDAMRHATEDLQLASDRMVRIAIVVIGLVRRYWLPVGVLLASALFRRARPMVCTARTGLAIWQTVRMFRNARR